MKKNFIMNLTLSAMFLTLGLLLPFLTAQIPQFGSMLLPMHIPVLLCGIICGPFWGGTIGLVLPLLRMTLFGSPPFLTALAMTFELCAYGLFIGLVYMLLPKKPWSVLVSLIASMILGRAVWGIATYLIWTIAGNGIFTIEMFLAGAFINAVPGIIVQIVLIPSTVLLLEKQKLMPSMMYAKNN